MIKSREAIQKQEHFMPKSDEQVFKNLQSYWMGQSSEPYSEKTLTLAYEPLNVGEMEFPDSIGNATGECGDSMRIYLKLNEGRIQEATFLSDGCGATLACGSAVTELVRGKTPLEASRIAPQALVRYLDGLPASHLHCAVLAVQTLQDALEKIR
jgi:nitrogen fixation NifU-like protein